VFTDKASGKDVKRPPLKAALEYLRDGDTLYVHNLDRLARNAEDLLRIVRELTERGVAVEFVKNEMMFSGNTARPHGAAHAPDAGRFAAFKRDLIRERQREGITIAKARGAYRGRKKALMPMEAVQLREMADAGMSKSELARTYQISRETVYQYLKAS
jgi:DNA invertase Pin-like site-specific DNA recombinase